MIHSVRYSNFYLLFVFLFLLLLSIVIVSPSKALTSQQPYHTPGWDKENTVISRAVAEVDTMLLTESQYARKGPDGGHEQTPVNVKSVSKPTEPNIFQKRYVFYRGNMNKASEVQRLINIMKRAEKAGYNGIVLGDAGNQYLNLERQPATYFSNFKRVKDTARKLGLVLIPYSMKQSDPATEMGNLIEALPVKGTKFIVRSGVALPEADPPVNFKNPGFEMFNGKRPSDWKVDDPGIITFVDKLVQHSGNTSIRIEDPHDKKGRLRQELSVKPFRAYEFSVWVKTQDFSDSRDLLRVLVQGMNGRKRLCRTSLQSGTPVVSSKGWKRYSIDFNSLDNTEIRIWFGAFVEKGERRTGKIWFDDAEIREVGLYKTVRRGSLPVTVTSWDGSTTYREGRDYEVGELKLDIPAGSIIPKGVALKVSWYQPADMVLVDQPASACDERYFSIIKKGAKHLNDLFSSPPGFFMQYNEWRVANWDPSCGALTGGQYIANVLHRSQSLLKDINPGYEIYLWSDMVSPYHNASSEYWVINGSVEGSWQGVSPETVIVNWGLKRNEKASLIFFWNLGHRQIIGGYYDNVDSVKKWLKAIDAVEAKGVRGITGFMYTTWKKDESGRGRYDDLEKVANIIRKEGRWGTEPAFPVRNQVKQ